MRAQSSLHAYVCGQSVSFQAQLEPQRHLLCMLVAVRVFVALAVGYWLVQRRIELGKDIVRFVKSDDIIGVHDKDSVGRLREYMRGLDWRHESGVCVISVKEAGSPRVNHSLARLVVVAICLRSRPTRRPCVNVSEIQATILEQTT